MKRNLILVFIFAFVGAGAALGVYSLISPSSKNIVKHEATNFLPAYKTSMANIDAPLVLPNFTEAANNTIHGVVHIKTEFKRKSNVYDYFFDLRDFFEGYNDRQSQPLLGAGSGVIISSDGYIVTNNHVVEEAYKIDVTLNDKRTFSAKVIGTDPSTDLALIKIDSEDLHFLTFGNSDDVKIGEWVLAVGNPFNLTSTVTAGIVSAKARNINILGAKDGAAIESFIQTDAAVNRGNSGGALVNTLGQLIGINAAIASGTGYYAGYSFAIPSNIVRKVVSDLRDYGTVQRGYMGVSVREIDSDLATENNFNNLNGVYVAEVVNGSSAQKVGIKKGDVIISIEGISVNSTSELLEIVGQHKPGDVIIVKLRSGNTEKDVKVVLKNKDGNQDVVKPEKTNIAKILGATFTPVSEKIKSNLAIKNGLQVDNIQKGKLFEAGVNKGFIILKIDGNIINSIKDIENILSNKTGGVLLEGIYPNGMRAYYGFGL